MSGGLFNERERERAIAYTDNDAARSIVVRKSRERIVDRVKHILRRNWTVSERARGQRTIA